MLEPLLYGVHSVELYLLHYSLPLLSAQSSLHLPLPPRSTVAAPGRHQSTFDLAKGTGSPLAPCARCTRCRMWALQAVWRGSAGAERPTHDPTSAVS